MIGLENTVLKSERLTYRLLLEQDKAVLCRLLSHRKVTEPAGFLPAKTTEEFDAFFRRLTQSDTGIAILHGQDLIGYIHVNKYTPDAPELKEKTCVSLGFVIGEEYQNNGYATETLTAITAYLKTRYDHCIADHFEDNQASQRVIQKSGYRYLEEYSMFFEELGRTVRCISHLF